MSATRGLVPGVGPGHGGRLAAVLAPVVLLVTLGVAGPAHAAQPAVTCGSTLTTDTTLTADLSCPSGDGLILARNVDLNLGGHKLVGPGTSGTGIASESGNVSIRNGVVKNWATGIGLNIDSSQTDPTQDPRVTDVVLRKAPSHISFGSTLVLARVKAVDSPVSGELGGNLRITRSTFTRSAISVFIASASIRRSTLVASTLNSSGQGRITVDRSRLDGRRTTRLGTVSETSIDITNSTVKNYRFPISGYYGGSTLTDNTFTDMHGVLGQMNSGLGSEGTATVRRNRFIRSGVALDPHIPMIVENNSFVDGTAGAVFSGSTLPGEGIWAPGRAVGNILKRNRGTGIASELPGLEVGRNTATRNGGYGINAPGAVDLGGNVAYGNRLGQCVGVVCSGR